MDKKDNKEPVRTLKELFEDKVENNENKIEIIELGNLNPQQEQTITFNKDNSVKIIKKSFKEIISEENESIKNLMEKLSYMEKNDIKYAYDLAKDFKPLPFYIIGNPTCDQQLKELKERNHEIMAHNNQFKKRNKKLEREFKRMTGLDFDVSYANMVHTNNQLMKERNMFNQVCERYEYLLKLNVSEREDELKNMNVTQEQLIIKLYGKNKRAGQIIADLKTKPSSYERAEFESRINTLRGIKKSQQKRIDELIKDNEEANKEWTEIYEKTVSEYEKKAVKINEYIKGLEQGNKILQQDKKDLDEKFQKTLAEMYDECNGKVHALRTEKEGKDFRIEQLEESLKLAENQYNTLRSEVEELKHKNGCNWRVDVQKELETSKNEVNMLGIKLSTQEAQIKELKLRNEELKSTNQYQVSEALNKQIEEYKLTIRNIKNQLKAKNNYIDSARTMKDKQMEKQRLNYEEQLRVSEQSRRQQYDIICQLRNENDGLSGSVSSLTSLIGLYRDNAKKLGVMGYEQEKQFLNG